MSICAGDGVFDLEKACLTLDADLLARAQTVYDRRVKERTEKGSQKGGGKRKHDDTVGWTASERLAKTWMEESQFAGDDNSLDRAQFDQLVRDLGGTDMVDKLMADTNQVDAQTGSSPLLTASQAPPTDLPTGFPTAGSLTLSQAAILYRTFEAENEIADSFFSPDVPAEVMVYTRPGASNPLASAGTFGSSGETDELSADALLHATEPAPTGPVPEVGEAEPPKSIGSIGPYANPFKTR